MVGAGEYVRTAFEILNVRRGYRDGWRADKLSIVTRRSEHFAT